MNGAHGAAEPGRPEGDVVVKKVRRSPQGEGEGGKGAPNGAPRAQPPGWEPLPSVDSLLEELLARVPAEPPGAGVSIETFTEELREIEAEMQNGGVGGAPATSTEPPEPPLSHEEEEAFASFTTLPEGDAGTGRAPPRPPDPLAQVVASPPRAVGPPPSQPFTGGHGGTRRVPAPCRALPDTPRVPRPLRVGAFWEAGEHAPQLTICQFPADGAGGPAGLLPPTSAPLLPAQHQHGLPAQCQVPAPGMATGEPRPSWSHGKALEKPPKSTVLPDHPCPMSVSAIGTWL